MKHNVTALCVLSVIGCHGASRTPERHVLGLLSALEPVLVSRCAEIGGAVSESPDLVEPRVHRTCEVHGKIDSFGFDVEYDPKTEEVKSLSASAFWLDREDPRRVLPRSPKCEQMANLLIDLWAALRPGDTAASAIADHLLAAPGPGPEAIRNWEVVLAPYFSVQVMRTDAPMECDYSLYVE